jgi:hypothetical protein
MFRDKTTHATGIGPTTEITTRFFHSVVHIGALHGLPDSGGLWPNESWAATTAVRSKDFVCHFFAAIGYMIGYAITLGIALPHPLSACTACIPLCDDQEFGSVGTMAPRYASKIRACIHLFGAMRRGISPFVESIRATGIPVQQLHSLFFDHDRSVDTLRLNPDALVLHDFSGQEEGIFRRWADSLDAAQTAAFYQWTTGSSKMAYWNPPISVHVDRHPTEFPKLGISVCARLLIIPEALLKDEHVFRMAIAHELESEKCYNAR